MGPLFSFLLFLYLKKAICVEENTLYSIEKNWPALSDWICEELYCSGLRIPRAVRNNNLWGKGVLEASDDEYLNLHAAALDSEPVDPFDNKDFLVTSSARLASHLVRFGIHQYANKKSSSQKNGSEKDDRKYVQSEKRDSREKDKKKEYKHWWNKFLNRQKKKKLNEDDTSGDTLSRGQTSPLEDQKNANFEYLLYGSGNKVSQSLGGERKSYNYNKNDSNLSRSEKDAQESNNSSTLAIKKKDRKLLNLREQIGNNDFNDNYSGPNYIGNQIPSLYPNQFSGPLIGNVNNYNRPGVNTYAPLNIKTSVFAAYFAAEPIIVHFSKTIDRNRRVKYGQEIGIAEAFPRTLNNELSNIILSRCDGKISIIYQMKGMPIQATRMFLVITCNDGP